MRGPLGRLDRYAIRLEASNFVRILRRAYVDQPLGVGFGPSRFSSPSASFRVMYAAQDFGTALAEAVVRDRFVGRTRRYIGRILLASRSVALIRTTAPLRLLDVRASAAYLLGVDTDAVRARSHGPGQAFSEWLHAETDFDGLLYDSRLTGNACIAIYERALAKVLASEIQPLLAHGDLAPELRRMRIVVRRP